MKKGIWFSLLFILFIVSGCSSGKAANTGGENTPVNTAPQSNSNPSQWGAPDRPHDLTGKVKTIRGNKLTVYKVITANDNKSEEEKAKTRTEMQALSPEERAKRREEQNKVTNETLNLLIPVGTPIIKNQSLGGKTETTKLEIGDIKEGDFLKLWLEKQSTDGEPMAEFVQVQQSIN